jgi:hypothetical protein
VAIHALIQTTRKNYLDQLMSVVRDLIEAETNYGPG